MNRSLTFAGAAAVTAVGIAAGGSPASADPATAVYVCGMGSLWSCPSVRPGEIAFGAHYAVVGLHWHSWKAATAYGRGHYFGFGSYEADVTLYTVRTHDGQRYFRHLKVTASGHRTRYLTYRAGRWFTG